MLRLRSPVFSALSTAFSPRVGPFFFFFLGFAVWAVPAAGRRPGGHPAQLGRAAGGHGRVVHARDRGSVHAQHGAGLGGGDGHAQQRGGRHEGRQGASESLHLRPPTPGGHGSCVVQGLCR